MLLKEKGYDEFLEQKIHQGREDFKAGRYYTAEQSRERVEALLKRKEKELAQQQLEQGVIYG